MNLRVYKEKRNFSQTKEPKGNAQKKVTKKSPIFVIHKHAASHLHWDLRLEAEGVLKSWAVPKGIPMKPGEKRLAMMVEDHPFAYQHFEGTIPKGNYGAGTVMIWDQGTYHSEDDKKEISHTLQLGDVKFFLSGKKIRGSFSLVKMKHAEKNSWLLIRHHDENNGTYLADPDISVASGKTMEEIAGVNVKLELSQDVLKEPMPLFIKPMMATAIEGPFSDEDWIFENKWDGYRAIVRKEKNDVRISSRNGKDYTEKFSAITESVRKIPGDFMLDGEIVAIDVHGKSSFQMLQNFLLSREGFLLLYVFDILFYEGYSFFSVPLEQRKKFLKKILPQSDVVKISEYITGEGELLFDQEKRMSGEGIVGKLAQSLYEPGKRSLSWVKIKTHNMQEAVICGFTEPRGGRKNFGALVLGVYEKGQLVYIGHTGGGFDEKNLSRLRKKLDQLAIKKCPFEIVPKTNMPATWVRPKLVCEVKFSEWTDDGVMRQPIFLGLREDKDPKEVVREIPRLTKKISTINLQKPEKSEITNKDKIFWPDQKYTKQDLIDYYDRIAPYILPYLVDRPQSLHRFPDGIKGKHFYQKNMELLLPSGIEFMNVFSESENRTLRYMLCQKKEDLLFMANLGCIDVNPWLSRKESLDNPDWAVLDLDPLECPFSYVVTVAQGIKKLLDEVDVQGFVKTSGATGMHVYIPLGGRYTYDESKEFCRLLAAIVAGRLPDIASIERSPEKRKGKVYVDFLQNRKGQTVAAPYCVRPVQEASVSTPLEWKEVTEKLDPKKFTMKNIFQRIKKKGDVWKDMNAYVLDMETAVEKLSKLLHVQTKKGKTRYIV